MRVSQAAATFVLGVTVLALSLLSDLRPAGAEGDAAAQTHHGLSLFGTLKYGPDFPHFDYVNPDAPKGGRLRVSAIGTFDSLNPFIIKGVPAAGLSHIYEPLMVSSYDEPSSEYGLIAESVSYPADYSSVTFTIRAEARWHDGTPITAEDVAFSMETLKAAHPHYAGYYANVSGWEILSPRAIRFDFNETGNRELPQIVGQLTILPKHYWEAEGRDFFSTTLEPPLASGPYRIAEVDQPHRITYERVKDYWAADLNVNVGKHNFDTIQYDYFQDQTVALEAFRADKYDVRFENSSKRWATEYTFAAVDEGRVIVEEIADQNAAPMQGFVLNNRRAPFDDRRVRLAFNYAFDFEWTNEALFYDQYVRTDSYFDNSELAATGLPEGRELELLEPYRDQLPEEVFTEVYKNPKTDGSGKDRANLRTAKQLLEEAGWQVENGILKNAETGEPMEVEFLLVSPDFERVVLPFINQRLKKLGISGTIRVVDPSQYRNRLDGFEFDIIIGGWQQSLSPGNEQRDYWSSAAAERQGSRNYAGISSPVVDALIDEIIFAKDREALIAATRALDRVLLWGYYVVPQWHVPFERVAYWKRIAHPETMPAYSIAFPDIWWSRGAGEDGASLAPDARPALFAGLIGSAQAAEADSAPAPRHGLSTFGELKYPPGFEHFDYVNPDAPKGGELSMIGTAALLSFDTLNGFILKGDPAQGLEYLFDSLMVRADDEPDAVYGLIAESVEVPADRSHARFHLRKEARFNDGSPLTAEDVAFTVETLKEDGHPHIARQLRDVAAIEVEDTHTILFRFEGELTRDLPLIIAELPIFSKTYYSEHDFTETTLEPPLGSGPYVVGDVQIGRSITYERAPDYWAKDLNVNRGRFNFDRLRYEYYRDRTAQFEALKAGEFDLREEFTSRTWATEYNFPAIQEGRVIKEVLPDGSPSGAQGWFLNMRREKFADPRVREALDYAFDFEWTNAFHFHGLYQRTRSYFENSEMMATGAPSEAELELLEPYRDQLPPEVFQEAYVPPVSDGSGQDRKNLRTAKRLLAEAGWTVQEGKLRNAKGETFEMEFLLDTPSFERILSSYIKNLETLGIEARIRMVDPAQYQRRLEAFDYDLLTVRYTMRNTPGIELRNYWSSAAAAIPGSRNLGGIADPVVDALIEKVIAARDRDALKVATRALDRVLRAKHYWIPQWFKASHHVAYWDKFGKPAIKPTYERGIIETWWVDPTKPDPRTREASGAASES